MIALFVAAALQAGGPSQSVHIAPDGTVTPNPRCRDVTRRYVQDRERRGGVRNLGELPPGRAELAVLKKVDGCYVSVLVARDAGGRRLEVPAGPGRLEAVPVARPSKAQRLPKRDR